MVENIGFILGKLWAFITSRPQKWFLIVSLLIISSIWLYKIILPSENSPEVCDCSLNTLLINTTRFDTLLQKKCEYHLINLTKEEKQEWEISFAECPKVKLELEHQQIEKSKKTSEKLLYQNCNSEAARNFVKNRFRDIGIAILQGPVLVNTNNSDCYYVFSVIAQRNFEVVGCEMAVKFEGGSFEVKFVDCH